MSEDIKFKELTEVNLNTVSELHGLFPHWKLSSVQKKLNITCVGKDRRFVALSEGKIVGHVRVIFGHGLHKHRIEITSLVVKPDFRKKGIGFGLMGFVLNNFSSNKKLVLLAVDSKNKVAIRLYKKLGFEKYGLLKKASLIEGKFVDNLLMKKNFI
jgi:ribosomal protein S18 acetylase RimI-like enzyme